MEFVRFENQDLLWLITILVPIIAYYVYGQIRGGVAVKLSSTRALRGARHTPMYWLRHLPFVLFCGALALIVVASARPQGELHSSESTTEGIEIVMALDISTSMLARDFTPDRFGAAKEISARFMLDRPSDRIGLVVFAGEAYTQSPLTTDHATLVNLLSQVEMGVINDGTAIGNGLTTAINRLRNSESPSKVVILLTDGENNSGQIDPMTAAELAGEFGIKVYTIGVGSEGTAPYPMRNMWDEIVYQDMAVNIDDELLTNISDLTGGKYYRATDNEKLEEIYKEIDSLEKVKVEVEHSVSYVELFEIYLLLALAALAAMVIFEYLILRKIP